jgi:hypothetical protein
MSAKKCSYPAIDVLKVKSVCFISTSILQILSPHFTFNNPHTLAAYVREKFVTAKTTVVMARSTSKIPSYYKPAHLYIPIVRAPVQPARTSDKYVKANWGGAIVTK